MQAIFRLLAPNPIISFLRVGIPVFFFSLLFSVSIFCRRVDSLRGIKNVIVYSVDAEPNPWLVVGGQ